MSKRSHVATSAAFSPVCLPFVVVFKQEVSQFQFYFVSLLYSSVKYVRALCGGKYVPTHFLTLPFLYHLSCCGIKITSCTKPSSSASL